MKKIYQLLIITAAILATSNPLFAQIVEWQDCNKYLGNISSGTTPDNWLNYWNQVSPENGGKWGSVEGTRDVMNWADLDKAYSLAKDNDLSFKLHVLVWGSQQPSWIESLTPEEQLAEIEEWIMMACERYPETDFIDVVNEPINAAPFGTGKGNYGNALGGTGSTGKDWIIKAFEMAREYCPNAQLMINEYNVLNSSSNINKYLAIIDLLKERDLIDAIGVQAHAFTVNTMKASEIKSSLDQLATSGLPIYVTELDIDTEGTSGTASELDQLQLKRYKEIFPAMWAHPSVKGITLWGYIKSNIWRTTAYLVSSGNNNATERPAMTWLKSYITESNSCGIETITSLPDIQLKSLTIYPNPSVSNKITLTSSHNMSSVSIIDMGGRLMHFMDLTVPVKSLDIPIQLQSGVYLIEVNSETSIDVQRMIVR